MSVVFVVNLQKDLSEEQLKILRRAFASGEGDFMVLPPAVTLPGQIDWQPMETAPRGDDAPFVLAWFFDQVVEVSWFSDEGIWLGHSDDEEFDDSELQAWAPKPAGPTFGVEAQYA